MHEHFFTSYVRLTGEWTVRPPDYCIGDYGLEVDCLDATVPSLTLHLFFLGREVYSDEISTYGLERSGGSSVNGKFTVRIYSWEIPTLDCSRRRGIGRYTWRISLADPFSRFGYGANVRHLNAIRTYCR